MPLPSRPPQPSDWDRSQAKAACRAPPRDPNRNVGAGGLGGPGRPSVRPVYGDARGLLGTIMPKRAKSHGRPNTAAGIQEAARHPPKHCRGYPGGCQAPAQTLPRVSRRLPGTRPNTAAGIQEAAGLPAWATGFSEAQSGRRGHLGGSWDRRTKAPTEATKPPKARRPGPARTRPGCR